MNRRPLFAIPLLGLALGLPLGFAVGADAQERTPLEMARVLAGRYPENPGMSYISGLSWSGGFRLAALTGEDRWRERPRAEMAPFLTGEREAIAEPYLLTSLAGHLAFADAGALDGNSAAADLAVAAAEFILPREGDEIVRFPRTWTDDMFMATSVLARVASRTNDPRYARTIGRLLISYAERLQRVDGIFIHAEDGPHPWGRGNGFAALGLMEALTWLPNDWSDRPRVLEIYRRHMTALARLQTDDGSWRQVLDQPTAYRELTVTSMTTAAMARGVRMGWLDAGEFLPVIEGGWRAVMARVGEDGSISDVCSGTGAQPSLEYYMTRPVVNGADDRGGAMALLASLEMEELRRSRQ